MTADTFIYEWWILSVAIVGGGSSLESQEGLAPPPEPGAVESIKVDARFSKGDESGGLVTKSPLRPPKANAKCKMYNYYTDSLMAFNLHDGRAINMSPQRLENLGLWPRPQSKAAGLHWSS